MGCQNSKLNGDILAIPPKLRPLLWRKVEELRKKRKGSGENNSGTLSKKELLTEGGDGFSRDQDSLHENEGLISDKTSSQDHDSVSSSVTQPKTTMEEKKIVYKEEIIIMEPEKKIEIMNKEIENQERSVIIYDKEEKGKKKKKRKRKERDREVKEEDRKEDQKDDEEDEREYIGPSSPSFRVYFIESLQDKDENEDEDEDEKEEEEEKLDEGKDDSKEDENDMQREWSGEINSENVVLINSNEEPKTKIIKKRSGKSRMRFRRALCRGEPVSVKHLLNVKSCYHPNSDVRASLLSRKSTS